MFNLEFDGDGNFEDQVSMDRFMETARSIIGSSEGSWMIGTAQLTVLTSAGHFDYYRIDIPGDLVCHRDPERRNVEEYTTLVADSFCRTRGFERQGELDFCHAFKFYSLDPPGNIIDLRAYRETHGL